MRARARAPGLIVYKYKIVIVYLLLWRLLRCVRACEDCRRTTASERASLNHIRSTSHTDFIFSLGERQTQKRTARQRKNLVNPSLYDIERIRMQTIRCDFCAHTEPRTHGINNALHQQFHQTNVLKTKQFRSEIMRFQLVAMRFTISERVCT